MIRVRQPRVDGTGDGQTKRYRLSDRLSNRETLPNRDNRETLPNRPAATERAVSTTEPAARSPPLPPPYMCVCVPSPPL